MEHVITHACQPSTVRGRGILVGGHRGKEQIAYTNGKSVVLRSLKNPEVCDIYTEHAHAATVARFCPNGEWVASADVAGNVRVWAAHALGCDHALKAEHRPLAGAVEDMAWSSDQQRIAVCGDGKETRAKCILWDSGNQVGSFDGIAKRCNSCDFKPTRPFGIVTGAEDSKVNFYEGPPFQFKQAKREHSNSVNCVRYSPDGERVLSVGSDQKGHLFASKSGDVLAELSSGQKGAGHTGSIYSAHWSVCSSKVLTASADKTVKLWDLSEASPTVITTFMVDANPQVEHMQVGSFWYGDFMGSISLNGDMNYFDSRVGSSPVKVVTGHSKTITALSTAPGNEVYTASYDGIVKRWKPYVECVGKIGGKGHASAVVGVLASSSSPSLMSCGMDNKILYASPQSMEFEAHSVALPGCPADIHNTADGALGVCVSSEGIHLVKDKAILSTTNISYVATSVAISPHGKEIAVGSSDMKVYVYEISGSVLTPVSTLEKHRGALTCMRYSDDESMLATGDANRQVFIWDRASKQVKHGNMVHHTARIQCLAWSPCSTKLATGSLDMSIMLWDLSRDPIAPVTMARAHHEGVTKLAFIDKTALVSTGADACVRVWKLTA